MSANKENFNTFFNRQNFQFLKKLSLSQNVPSNKELHKFPASALKIACNSLFI